MISRHIPSCYSSGILEPFVPEVTKLLEASNSKNMWNTYQNDIFSFVPFRLNQGLRDTWPSSISDLVNYVAYLSSFGYAPSTVKVYLSGLSHWLRLNQMSDFTQSFNIQKMLKGMDRLYVVEDSCKPITLELLVKLMNSLQFVCSSNYECTLFRSMFSLAFFALLRIGEITVNNNTRHVINKGDINVSQDLQVIKLTIPFSKTDQKGLSTTIAVCEFNQTAICPATLLSKYISVRHNENGPLFCHYNKNGVTRYQFTKVLHKALEFIGINPHDYNTHSFRIGSAT